MPDFIWTLDAESDAQRHWERLESRAAGAGERFQVALDHSLKLLRVFPDLGRAVHPVNIRRLMFCHRRFGLFYRVEARGIILHAILDLCDSPMFLERRIDQITEGLPPE